MSLFRQEFHFTKKRKKSDIYTRALHLCLELSVDADLYIQPGFFYLVKCDTPVHFPPNVYFEFASKTAVPKFVNVKKEAQINEIVHY